MFWVGEIPEPVCLSVSLTLSPSLSVCIAGEKLVLLKSKLQQAMAQRRQEERQKRAALYRLDNEDCLEEEEEEEEEMTDESEGEEEVRVTVSGSEFTGMLCCPVLIPSESS